MLDGLLGRGYVSKCKSLIKLTKTRIDAIRRKRNATQKFLRKDIADLLSNGLDMNAYGRADGLLVEMIVSSCYDFVQACCDVVLKHLSIMQKQRECPEECKTAVSSLMFAAARFSDLPELRDLRQMFQERYGNSLEYSVNQEFVDNLAAKPSTLENKIQLMKDVASEFLLKWDSEAFEQMMFRQSTVSQASPQVRGPSQVTNDKFDSATGKEMMHKRDKHDVLLKDRVNHNDLPKMCNGNGYKTPNARDEAFRQKDGHDSMQVRKEFIPDKQEAWNGKVNILHEAKLGTAIPHVKSNSEVRPADNYVQHIVVESVSKDEVAPPKVKSYCNNVPPPYVKPNGKAKDRKYADQLGFQSYGTTSKDSSTLDRASAENMSKITPMGSDHSEYESHFLGPPRANGQDLNKKDQIKPDDLTVNSIPRPRSVRRRNSKSRSSNVSGYSEDTGVGTRKPRNRRRDDSKLGLQVLLDEQHSRCDEEERIIDRMLIHYSKKTSTYEPGKLRRKPKSRHAHQNGTDAGESPYNESRYGPGEDSDIIPPPPGRSVSLPLEETGPSEVTKVFDRAASLQPERSNPARHVHPKLPEYDDLAARIAALRGR